MRANVKDLWLKALRSGDYVQGNQRLEGISGGKSKFCCLGVLVDTLMKNPIPELPTIKRIVDPNEYDTDEGLSCQDVTYSIGRDSRAATTIPWELANAIEFPESLQWDYIDMNDTHNKTFAEIADAIEDRL